MTRKSLLLFSCKNSIFGDKFVSENDFLSPIHIFRNCQPYLNKKEQKEMLEAMEFAQCTPSLSQALRIKKLSTEGKLTVRLLRRQRIKALFLWCRIPRKKCQTLILRLRWIRHWKIWKRSARRRKRKLL